MMLKLGVPSKGRLMEKTFSWFGDRGVTLRKAGSEREYSGAVDGIEGIELVLLSAGEIPRELAAGRIHLGVTGSDLVREKLANWDVRVTEVALMGFGGADLIIAVPQSWVDVDTLDDLDAAAAAFRAKHGFRMRIATKYHRLVREFLRETVSRIISSWIARVPRRGSSKTRPPKRLRTSHRQVRLCVRTV